MHCKKHKFGRVSRLLLSGAASLSLFTLSMKATQAAIIPGIYNTGVDNTGTVLPDQATDTHYTITQTPAGNVTQAPFVTKQSDWQFGVWAADTATSKWISPQSTYGNNGGNPLVADAVGNYDYETTFNLAGYNAATAVLTGEYVVDNLLSVYLNGVYTGTSAPGLGNWKPFTISSGFNQGVNTLDFIVENNAALGSNPSGMQIQISGTATVPEPASMGLTALAVVALAGRRRSPSQ